MLQLRDLVRCHDRPRDCSCCRGQFFLQTRSRTDTLEVERTAPPPSYRPVPACFDRAAPSGLGRVTPCCRFTAPWWPITTVGRSETCRSRGRVVAARLSGRPESLFYLFAPQAPWGYSWPYASGRRGGLTACTPRCVEPPASSSLALSAPQRRQPASPRRPRAVSARTPRQQATHPAYLKRCAGSRPSSLATLVAAQLNRP